MNRKKRKWAIDLNAATATSNDGWLFAFIDAEDDDALEVECLDHPDNLTEKQLDAADAIAAEAAEAFMDAMGESEAITIDNDGKEIRQTSFWDSELAQHGYVFVSLNEGAIRMLLPPSAEAEYLPEMKTGKSMLIEPSQQHDGSLDFVFEDGTDSPFWVVVDTRQIDAEIRPGKNIPFYVYTRNGKQLELKARTRFPEPEKKKKK
ncbi:hypothetical protein LJC19_04420 [Oxalobacter sp. OttesenSCG-928-P03]|nr:hypothetical protein [Oxalobacter sp. OttesenSCG-928-P03]